ncbi:MAG: restriction endonuclease, partial [Sphingomicrobium sp.]
VLSGTEWEIDAKGIQEANGATIVIECRRYKNALNQEALAAVAYRIHDVGAAGGITVSPMPLQKGAAKVSAANNIQHVRLTPESTKEQWAAHIGSAMHYGITMRSEVKVMASMHAQLIRGGKVVEERNEG